MFGIDGQRERTAADGVALQHKRRSKHCIQRLHPSSMCGVVLATLRLLHAFMLTCGVRTATFAFQGFTIWSEGAEGAFTADLKSVSAVSSPPAGAAW